VGGWQMGWLMGGVGCGSEERLGNGMGIGPVHGTFIRGPAVSASGGSMQKNLDASRLSVVSTSDVQFGFCLSGMHAPATASLNVDCPGPAAPNPRCSLAQRRVTCLV